MLASVVIASAVLTAAAGIALRDSRANQAATPSGNPNAPRLVVVIVIDQLRHDLIERYRPHFSSGGFLRFLRDGARFTQARYLHGTTDTCPGHAAISTGSWGNENGIVANQWHDVARGQGIGCSAAVRAAFAGKLLRPTVGEALKRGQGHDAKVIAVSGKQTAAQLLGGAAADGVFWAERSGHFATWNQESSLPSWARQFNASGRVEAISYATWHRLLPADAYAVVGPDDDPAERGPDGRRAKFPHYLGGGAHPAGSPHAMTVRSSPFADELLADFVIAAIRAERLGGDDVTDYLAVSFSSSDVIAHAFGPDSHESMDTVLRLDRQIEKLLHVIDKRVGRNRALVVLTADHGVAPLPEVAQRHGWSTEAGRISEEALDAVVEQALAARYGKAASGNWLAFHDFPNVYLNEAELGSRGIDVAEAERVAGAAVAAFPGVRKAWTRTELARFAASGTMSGADRAVLLSFHPQRSGHVVYQVAAYRVVADQGSNHGSDWDYDSRVPLMWLGPGIRAGEHHVPASPVDIAPTLYALLGLEDPGTSGRVLSELWANAPGLPRVSPAGD